MKRRRFLTVFFRTFFVLVLNVINAYPVYSVIEGTLPMSTLWSYMLIFPLDVAMIDYWWDII